MSTKNVLTRNEEIVMSVFWESNTDTMQEQEIAQGVRKKGYLGMDVKKVLNSLSGKRFILKSTNAVNAESDTISYVYASLITRESYVIKILEFKGMLNVKIGTLLGALWEKTHKNTTKEEWLEQLGSVIVKISNK